MPNEIGICVRAQFAIEWTNEFRKRFLEVDVAVLPKVVFLFLLYTRSNWKISISKLLCLIGHESHGTSSQTTKSFDVVNVKWSELLLSVRLSCCGISCAQGKTKSWQSMLQFWDGIYESTKYWLQRKSIKMKGNFQREPHVAALIIWITRLKSYIKLLTHVNVSAPLLN